MTTTGVRGGIFRSNRGCDQDRLLEPFATNQVNTKVLVGGIEVSVMVYLHYMPKLLMISCVAQDQLLWAIRDWLRNEPAMLPPDPELQEELTVLTYEIKVGKIKS